MRRLIRMHPSILTLPLLLAANPVFAAGFSLLEQSSSRLGTAFAGTAAAADDATTIYFNPAGMIHLDGSSAVVSLSDVYISSEFANANSLPALGQTLGNEGGNAGGMNWVPSAYWTAKLSENFAIGFGVNAPFGLKLEYDTGWIGRFQAMKSEITTLNLNPAFAWRVNEVFTIAAGIDYQNLEAELTNAVNYSAVVAQGLQQLALGGTITPGQAAALATANAGLQGGTVVSGDDWDWGFNVGVLIDASEAVRFGLAYRSQIKYKVEGDVKFTRPTAPEPIGAGIINIASAPGAPLSDGPVYVNLKVPASATASYWQQLNPTVELMADLAWTQWSSIPELRVVRTSGTTLSVTPENWDNTWRAAFGAAFVVTPDWKIRAGTAYDQTPVPDSTRTPRLPDTNRYWIAVGAGWAPKQSSWSIDFGYAHLFGEDVPLNQNAGNTSAYGLINGEQSTAIDILTAQVGYKF